MAVDWREASADDAVDFEHVPHQPNPKLMNPVFKDTITVVVSIEPNVSTFYLPATALRTTSEFFARALKCEWTSATRQPIRLPHIDPVLFDLFAQWLTSGAKILTDENNWKAEHREYIQWRRELEDEENNGRLTKRKLDRSSTVWDFEKTTEAWFLGDYLQSRDFQNHCMGHLYYMHLRFDHILAMEEDVSEDPTEESWYWGTIAYVQVDDVLYTWEMTEHQAGATPFLLEQHPLRRFYVDWLKQYWDAYEVSDWDYKVQDGIVELIKFCPDLIYKQLRGCTATGERRKQSVVRELDEYWV